MLRKRRRQDMREAAARARGEADEPKTPATKRDAQLANTLGSQQLPDEIECPRCAERIKARAKDCRFCGAEISVAGAKRGRSERLARQGGAATVHHHHHFGGGKSGGVAAVLAFLLPGLGHIYAGRVAAGLVYMFLAWPLLVLLFAIGFVGASATKSSGGMAGTAILFFVAWAGLWVWQIVDAYQSAERQSRAGRSWRRL